MADQQTAPPVVDKRLRLFLQVVCGDVVDATGEGRNGEVFKAYRPDVDFFRRPDEIPYRIWIVEQIDAALSKTHGPTRAMLDARARLGENLHLIKDIDLGKVRAGLDDSDKADKIDALLDFVAEIRKIAKEI